MKKPAATSIAPQSSTVSNEAPARNRRRPTKQTPVTAMVAPTVEPVAQTTPEVAKPENVVGMVAAEVDSGKKKKKVKVVRDSFTMPASDYAKIAELKKKSLEAGVSIKKSELLRAGLHALEALPVAKLKALLSGVENLKTGRPTDE